jgi:CheY-like chemotaxis protein
MEPTTDPGAAKPLADRVIIVIDDDLALLSLMSTFLRRAGATVHVAGNGRAALALLETLHAASTAVHAVLCDLRMTGGSGMDLYRQLNITMPWIVPRMIFSSGDLDSDDVRAFMDDCSTQVLAKPYPLAELKRILAALPPPA